jgi:hypothetical protein
MVLMHTRYYYAIITCDTVDAATHIYRELEDTELERSANVFDLSFVPEDMTFDSDCRYTSFKNLKKSQPYNGNYRDEATAKSSSAFKSVDFVTDVGALLIIQILLNH